MELQGRTAFFISVFFVQALILSNVFAGERYEFYDGVRQMGMGGAVAATVNDETALLSNPAALGKLRDSFATVIDPEIEGNMNVEKTLGTGFYKASDPQYTLDHLRGHEGVPLHLKAQAFPSLIFPNFGLGVHANYRTDAEVNEAGTAYRYDYRNDFSAVGGFNFRFFNGIMKLGANVRYTNRTEVKRDDLDPNSTNLTLSGLAQEGVGIGSDVGLILAAPVLYLPTVAAVWHDVGDTSYSFSKGMFMSTTDRPDSVKNTLDVAVALFPIHANNVRSSWTVELKDVLTKDSAAEPIMRRLHAGFELNFADALFLRGGMNQRYWTAGLEISMIHSQLQAATYGEDIGTADHPREDRRFVVKYSFRF
jgi:hypothetical protein